MLIELFKRDGIVDHWQTLIAGLVALLAALIGGFFVHRQITAERVSEEKRRRRKFSATRAVLPLTLSSLCDYASQTNSTLRAFLGMAVDGIISKQNIPVFLPTISPQTVEELRVLVELGDGAFTDYLSNLLIKLQINTARLRSIAAGISGNGEETTTADIEGSVVDTAEIYAMVAALFDFARRVNDKIPPPPTGISVKNALKMTGLSAEEFPQIYRLSELYFDGASAQIKSLLREKQKKS